MTREDGGPAFPMPYSTDEHSTPCNVTCSHGGMTLRDYFAAHAPAMPVWFEPQETPEWFGAMERLARWRWAYADAMLKERSK